MTHFCQRHIRKQFPKICLYCPGRNWEATASISNQFAFSYRGSKLFISNPYQFTFNSFWKLRSVLKKQFLCDGWNNHSLVKFDEVGIHMATIASIHFKHFQKTISHNSKYYFNNYNKSCFQELPRGGLSYSSLPFCLS